MGAFMDGSTELEDNKIWQLLMTLKNIVALVMAPGYTDVGIGYYNNIIGFLAVFLCDELTPKHHFYIIDFGFIEQEI